MKKIFLSLLCICVGVFSFFSCSSSKKPQKQVCSIAMDPSWYPLDLEGKGIYVMGFLDQLFKEMSKVTGVTYQFRHLSWDNVVDVLKNGTYPAILSPIPPNVEQRLEFDFSELILSTGPVLIVKNDSKIEKISDFREAYIGCLQYSSEDLYIQTQSNVLPYYYPSPAAALFGLSTGQVDGVMIGVVPAVSYIKDLYDGFLKIVGQPIGNSGIRLLTKKGENQQLIQSINQALQIEKQQKNYQSLMVKWTVGTAN